MDGVPWLTALFACADAPPPPPPPQRKQVTILNDQYNEKKEPFKVGRR